MKDLRAEILTINPFFTPCISNYYPNFRRIIMCNNVFSFIFVTLHLYVMIFIYWIVRKFELKLRFIFLKCILFDFSIHPYSIRSFLRDTFSFICHCHWKHLANLFLYLSFFDFIFSFVLFVLLQFMSHNWFHCHHIPKLLQINKKKSTYTHKTNLLHPWNKKKTSYLIMQRKCQMKKKHSTGGRTPIESPLLRQYQTII